MSGQQWQCCDCRSQQLAACQQEWFGLKVQMVRGVSWAHAHTLFFRLRCCTLPEGAVYSGAGKRKAHVTLRLFLCKVHFCLFEGQMSGVDRNGRSAGSLPQCRQQRGLGRAEPGA